MEENKLTDEEIVKDMIAHKRAADAYAFVQITGPQMQRWLDLIHRLQDDYSNLKERYVKVLDLNEKVISEQKAEIERLTKRLELADKDNDNLAKTIFEYEKQVDELTASREIQINELHEYHAIVAEEIKQQAVKGTVKKCADWIDNERGYCGLGHLLKKAFGVEVE